MKTQVPQVVTVPPLPGHLRGPMTRRWLRRTLWITGLFWAIAVLVPQALDLSHSWRAFGAGLVVPGAGLLYAIPEGGHPVSTAHLAGHAAVIVLEAAAAIWALRRFKSVVTLGVLLVAALVVAGVAAAPYAVVVVGHVAAFVGVLVACLWAFGSRLIGAADFVTLPVIVVVAAAAGGALVVEHGATPGPMTWIAWAALVAAVVFSGAMLLREQGRFRAGLTVGQERQRYLEERATTRPGSSDVVPLRHESRVPSVTEATPEEMRLLRYLMSVALQPVDDWSSYDKELPGPLAKYRYQVNALGWALSTYAYSHTPSFSGVLLDAQAALVDRLQQKQVWGYWYWQNLLGNLDLVKRRADPIDVPQNIMFSGYLNLQLGLFRHATGDRRYDDNGAIVFDWSPQQRFSFDHPRINDIVIRNFGEDLCLWPCEPAPLGLHRKRGFVFPYCNAVAAASVGVTDRVQGTHIAPEIGARVEQALQREFTTSAGDLVAFIAAGAGITARIFAGPTTTAGVAGFLAPLCPDLAWRSWEILRRDWLDNDRYRIVHSAGGENPDWGSGAKTNAGPIAAAMFLARECGEQDWHEELWKTALDQLDFRQDAEAPGLARFEAGSVHANGMLGFGGFGRGRVLTDMMTVGRPQAWTDGPRLAEIPHPDVLVAKAVSDGAALDLVLYPGRGEGRFALRIDHLRPHSRYLAHGAVDAEVTSDAAGEAMLTVDLGGRSPVALRPA